MGLAAAAPGRDHRGQLDGRSRHRVLEGARRSRLARHDLAGRGRGRRSTADRAAPRRRAAHLGRCPARLHLVRRSADGPHPHPVRHRRAEGALPAGHPRRHPGVGDRDERARRRVQRRRHPDPRRPRGRRLPGERPEDLDVGRPPQRLHLPDLPDRPGRAGAQGALGARRPARLPRHHHRADHRHDREPALQRGVPRGRRGPRREPGGPAQRQLRPGHAPARARARRHRPAGVEQGAVRRAPPPRRPRRPGRCARSWPSSRRASASVACWCCGRCWARPPPASRPPPRRSAPASSSAWRSSAPRILGAAGHARRAGPPLPGRPRPLLRPGVHDHGRHRRRS